GADGGGAESGDAAAPAGSATPGAEQLGTCRPGKEPRHAARPPGAPRRRPGRLRSQVPGREPSVPREVAGPELYVHRGSEGAEKPRGEGPRPRCCASTPPLPPALGCSHGASSRQYAANRREDQARCSRASIVSVARAGVWLARQATTPSGRT